MAEEYFQLLDENKVKLGVKKIRDLVHQDGDWHAACHVWVYNSFCEILFQKRTLEKESHPGMWDISSTGHVIAGELAIESALRELQEEIGIKAKPKDLEFVGARKVSEIIPEKDWKNNEFVYTFLMEYDGDIKNLELQKEEVDEIRWISIETLKKELNDKEECKKYVPHGDYYFKIMELIEEELEN